jgi:hypothetical protein
VKHKNETDNTKGTDAALDQNDEDLDALLDEIFAEMTTEAESESENQEIVPGWDWEAEKAVLLDLLDGPYRDLRDQNHLHTSVLVWDQGEKPSVFEVEPLDLPTRFPLKGPGSRWVAENYGETLEAKSALLRQSKVAHELSEEDPTSSAVCGTVVLVVPANSNLPYRWAEVKSRLLPCPAN